MAPLHQAYQLPAALSSCQQPHWQKKKPKLQDGPIEPKMRQVPSGRAKICAPVCWPPSSFLEHLWLLETGFFFIRKLFKNVIIHTFNYIETKKEYAAKTHILTEAAYFIIIYLFIWLHWVLTGM